MIPEIIFEDNHLFVVNKPAGLLTQPSGTEQSSLEGVCKQWIKEKYQKPGNVFLEAIHRLDKPVSGIVLFAKTSKALSRLQESMRKKDSKKVYIALIEGVLNDSEGNLEHILIHDDFKATVVSKNEKDGKVARLHYVVVERCGDKTRVEITLDTGRYHQIRAQFSAIGHPIVGDKKYGSTLPFEKDCIALHHTKLVIPHPITGELQTFSSSPKF